MTLQGYSSNFDDADLTASNIKSGVNIFWVEGTFGGLVSWWTGSFMWGNARNSTAFMK